MEKWMNYWKNTKVNFQKRCNAEREQLIKSFDNPMEVQRDILQKILLLNKNTVYGKQFGFSTLKSIDEYKRCVPVLDYEGYRRWIEKEIEQKGGVLNSSKILRYLKTSGTTGKNKAIPFTQYWMEQSRTPALYALWGNYYKYDNNILDNPYSVLDLSTVREPVTETLNGIPYQSISNRNIIYNEKDWEPCWYNAPWFDESVPVEYDEKMYYRIRYFIGKDLKLIVSINPSTLIALYGCIKNNKKRLIEDIKLGTLNGEIIAEPNNKLAEQVHQIINSNNFTMNDLWKNLKMISAWTASSTELYLPKLKEIYPLAIILPYMACGSEGIVAIPVDNSLKAAPLAINHGFYEFIPEEISYEEICGSPRDTLLFNELEIGKNYHLIMSQANGLMRYMTGDIYKVVDFYKNVPMIEFVTRANTFFSFTGEKITEEQILSTVQNVCSKLCIKKGLFFFTPIWAEVPYYKLYLEVPTETFDLKEKLVEAFDFELRKVSYEFDSKRESERLQKTQVICLQYGTIDKFIEKQKKQGNGVQFKYKPFVKEHDLLEILENML